MLKEFKEFAFKGNVLDLAIAVVMGAAFNKIVSSLVTYIIMPLIGKLFGSVDFAKDWQIWGIKYGLFIQSIIDFIIVAFALFIFVKIANTIIRKEEPEEEIDTNTVLLTEIRDLLKQIINQKHWNINIPMFLLLPFKFCVTLILICIYFKY